MSQSDKIKITQKDFDELYEIEEITGETKSPTSSDQTLDTTPKTKETLFSEDELKSDQELEENLGWDAGEGDLQ